MYFAFNEDQETFRESLAGLLAEHAPMRRVREVAEGGGYDTELWRLLCSDMAVLGLHVAERDGGQGFSYVETAILMQELGRTLAPVPVFATTAAVEAVSRLGSDEQKQSLLPGLLSGDDIGALAITGPDDLEPDSTGVRAERAGNSYLLDGSLGYVMHGHVADLLVVPAVDESGRMALFTVRTAEDEVTVQRRESLDLTRPVARVELHRARAWKLGDSADIQPGIERVTNVARTLLASEMLGTAEECLRMAVEHASQRVQFNRTIGSFQAVKHKCADMAIAVETVQGTAMFAAMSAGSGGPEFGSAALMAKVQAANALTQCAGESIQVHGGIGFTWEMDTQLYFRRAKALEPVLGNNDHHHALLADAVGI